MAAKRPMKLAKSEVLTLCGGKWPETPDGFCFDAVSHFEVHDGVIYGWLGGGPIGPSLKIVVVDDPLSYAKAR